MSTTYKYGAIFYLPMAMIDTPLEFQVMHKGFDELNNDLGYYTYRERYVNSTDGHKDFYTPSGTHFYLEENITSSFLKDDATTSLTGSPFVWLDAKQIERWKDLNQAMYIWCVTTDKRMKFNNDEFMKVSSLFITSEPETTGVIV